MDKKRLAKDYATLVSEQINPFEYDAFIAGWTAHEDATKELQSVINEVYCRAIQQNDCPVCNTAKDIINKLKPYIK